MAVRVQIVGCGAVVEELYLRPLVRLEQRKQIQVAALVDPNRTRTHALRRYFPAAQELPLQLAEFVCDQVDLTLITSPPAYHADQTIAALRWGSHVLCEKPMAASAPECRRMTEAAAETGRALGIGMPRRFYPAFQHLKKLIDRGALGDDLHFTYREGGAYDWPIKSGEGFSRSHGGGVLLDIGPHVLDILQWLFGPLTVEACRDDALGQGIEANCLIQLRSARANGSVQLSWDQNLVNEFRIEGDRGEALVDPSALNRIACRHDGQWRVPRLAVTFPATLEASGARRASPRTYSDCIYHQLVQMLRCLALGESPAVTAEEGARVMALIEACYGLAEPLSMDWLTLEEMSACRALHWRPKR